VVETIHPNQRDKTPLRQRLASFRERFGSSEVREVAENYLANFNLNWDNLQGKRVLDIGAGAGEFGKAAKRRGIDTISFDKYEDAGLRDGKRKLRKRIPRVIGDAKNLSRHFSLRQFDLVVSREAVKFMVLPMIPDKPVDVEEIKGRKRTWHSENRYKVREDVTLDEISDNFAELFSEVKKVLKPGGEFRFDTRIWSKEIYLLNNPLAKSTDKNEPGIIEKQALDFLKSIDPNISMDDGKTSDGKSSPFFILKKT